MNFLRDRIGRRLRFITLFLIIISCVWISLGSSKTFEPTILDEIDPQFQIVEARKNFKNPVLRGWPEYKALTSESRCVQYWNLLLKTPLENLQSPHPDFDFEPGIYKKSKWMINAKNILRRKLHDQGIKMTDEHVEELKGEFYKESRLVSQLEEYFVNQMTHLRILGKSMFSGGNIPLDLTSKGAKTVINHLIPWLKDSNNPLSEFLFKTKQTNGILITIFPSSKISIQMDRISLLLRVLRVQGNELPIQIAYAGENGLTKEGKNLLLRIASSKSKAYELALDEVDSDISIKYPKQELLFLDVAEFIRPDMAISDNLMYFVAVMTSEFENTIVFNSQNIPMIEDFSLLLENEQYKSQGTFLFKHRPLLDSRPEPFPPGFFEVNELLNQYASVSHEETAMFGMNVLKNIHTKRVTELGFQRLTDPSLAVFNKQKTVSGLLISSVLPFHSIIKPRYDLSVSFNPELIWLGQELAGQNDYVHFNSYFASIPGVLTPAQNLPPGFFSSELCSSSWSQISGYSEKLIYVTSHQLENRVLPSFKAAVRAKLSVKSGKAGGKEETDSSLAQKTIAKNLLFIKSALQPVSIENPLVNEDGQPFFLVQHVDDFGSIDDYWCGYDVVGSEDQVKRGFVYDYNDNDVRRFLFYLDVWLQLPDPGPDSR